MAQASDSIAIGLTIDIVQGILTLLIVGIVLNPIISFVAGLCMSRSKHTARILITTFGEVIPLVNVLPMWTISAVVGKYLSQKEERELRKKKLQEASLANAPRPGGRQQLMKKAPERPQTPLSTKERETTRAPSQTSGLTGVRSI